MKSGILHPSTPKGGELLKTWAFARFRKSDERISMEEFEKWEPDFKM